MKAVFLRRSLAAGMLALFLMLSVYSPAAPAYANAEGVMGPQFLDFSFNNDSKNKPGFVSGTLYWSIFGTVPEGAAVNIAFFDDNDTQVGVAIPIASVTTNTYTLPSATAVPEGGTRIGVQLIANSTVLTQLTKPIWYYSTYMPTYWKWQDTDPGAGLQARISWHGAADESVVNTYRIYYESSDATRHFVAVVSKSAVTEYTYTLPEVPGTAVKYLLGITNIRGEEAPVYPTFWIANDLSGVSDASASISEAILPSVSNVIAYNNAAVSGHLQGYVSWTYSPVDGAGPVSDPVSGFKLYYGNESGERLKPIGTLVNPRIPSTVSLTYPIASPITIPAGAERILVYTMNANGAESATAVSVVIPNGLWHNVTLGDLNGDGRIDIADAALELRNLSDKNGDGHFDRDDVRYLLEQIGPRLGLPS